jgi:HEAT repeat protein
MRRINKEAEQEQKAEYLYVLINDLEEILLHLGEDADAYENMISYFDRTLKSLLEQGDIGRAVAILEDLSNTIESMVLKDKQIFAIRRILEASSDARSVELLGKHMKNGEEGDSGSILQYFRFLTKQAVDPLCLLLGDLNSGKWRKVTCDCIAQLSRDEIQPVARLLSNPNPLTVCHGLYILGKVGHPSTTKYLATLVTHPDLKVREETLKLTTRFEEKGKDLFEKFLKDPVPEMRAKASLLYAKTVKGKAVKPLAQIILAEDFYKREYEEKAAFFRALGETGSEEAVPILKKIAKKRRWFNKAKWDEMRLCANNTLKMLGAEKR